MITSLKQAAPKNHLPRNKVHKKTKTSHLELRVKAFRKDQKRRKKRKMLLIYSSKTINYYLEEMPKQNLTKLETKEICGNEFSFSKKLARGLKISRLGGVKI